MLILLFIDILFHTVMYSTQYVQMNQSGVVCVCVCVCVFSYSLIQFYF